MPKTIGLWGSSLAIRLDSECKELGLKIGDKVNIYIKEEKIIIEKLEDDFKLSDGAKFVVKK